MASSPTPSRNRPSLRLLQRIQEEFLRAGILCEIRILRVIWMEWNEAVEGQTLLQFATRLADMQDV